MSDDLTSSCRREAPWTAPDGVTSPLLLRRNLGSGFRVSRGDSPLFRGWQTTLEQMNGYNENAYLLLMKNTLVKTTGWVCVWIYTSSHFGCVRIQRLLGERKWESIDLTGRSEGARHQADGSMSASGPWPWPWQWVGGSGSGWRSWGSLGLLAVLPSRSVVILSCGHILWAFVWIPPVRRVRARPGDFLPFSGHCMSSDPVIRGQGSPPYSPQGGLSHLCGCQPLLYLNSQQPPPVALWRMTATYIKF